MTASARFVPHIALLAVLAGAVVLSAWLSPRRADPCAHPDVLPVTGLIPGSRPEGERRDQLGGDIVQWSEGRLTGPGLPRLQPQYCRINLNGNVRPAAKRPQAVLQTTVEPGTPSGPRGPGPFNLPPTSTCMAMMRSNTPSNSSSAVRCVSCVKGGAL